jgi:PAS domain S-box-containing protein
LSSSTIKTKDTIAPILQRVIQYANVHSGTFVLAFGFILVFLTQYYSYLVFHTLAELFSIVVAYLVFIMAWKSQRFLSNGYLLFVGISFLFVGTIDLVHTLAYKGMGVFVTYDSDLPTQLWIAARYLQAVSMLAAPLFLYRRINPNIFGAGFTVVTALLGLSIFYWDIFPIAFVEGVGLTPFKRYSEYLIALIFGISGILLYQNRDQFDRKVLQWLLTSLGISILSELAFTEYASVYGMANMVGHMLKILAFFFVYKAIVETGFDKPYNILFRQLKANEEALRLSEARIRRLVDSNIIGVIFTDCHGGITSANDAFLTMLGYSLDDLFTGKLRWTDLTPVDFKDKDDLAIAESLSNEKGACTPYEKEFIHKDGRRIPVLVGFALLEGSHTEYINFILDTSEMKKAQEALTRIEWILTKSGKRRSAEGLDTINLQPYGDLAELNRDRTLLKLVGKEVLSDVVGDFLEVLDTSAAVYEKNGDYALWTFSSGWCRHLNQASRELCRTTSNQEALGSGKWLCHESCWTRAASKSMVTKEPMDVPCAGGINIYTVPIMAAEEVVGALSVGYGDPPTDPKVLQEIAARYETSLDKLQELAATYQSRPSYMIELAKNRLEVSARLLGALVQRQRAENEAQAYARKLELTNQELEDFTSIASHDLQEPLRKIQSFGSKLKDRYEGDPVGKDYLERMVSGADRLQRMIQALLSYSRVTRQMMTFEPVDLSDLARQVISDFEVSLEESGGEVVVGDLPVVEADPIQMRQLLQNLISNAVKFHKEGVPPVVRVDSQIIRRNNGSAPLIQMFVADNGIGFDKKYTDQIFQPFQRLVGKKMYEGSGIGLSICRKIVERHHGSLAVESTPEVGTTFIITLPLKQSP